MKKVLFILLLGLVTVVYLTGCEKTIYEKEYVYKTDTLFIENEPEVENEYYIKYHFKCDITNGYTGLKCTIWYINSYLNESENVYGGNRIGRIENDIICGPFKMGDNLSLRIRHNYENDHYVAVSCLLEIYVSKNNSPFALKQQTNSSSIKYKIDF